MDRGRWGGAAASQEMQLHRAFLEFKQWAKSMKIPLLEMNIEWHSELGLAKLRGQVARFDELRHSQHSFSVKSATGPYPELHSKAYNATGCAKF